MEDRLKEHNYNSKEAFKDLDNNPVWYNAELKIPIKTIRRKTNLSAIEPVKKDTEGNAIGFVKPGNNHHIAIYIDEKGKRREHLCSFWHAVERKKYLLPVIIKKPKEVWDKILNNKENYPENFLEKLPNDRWIYEESLQQNEMFILGLTKDKFEDAINKNNKPLLSKNLFRVQKMASSDYWFRHHLETELIDSNEAKLAKRFFRFKSIGAFIKENPIKVNIDRLGNISMVY